MLCEYKQSYNSREYPKREKHEIYAQIVHFAALFVINEVTRALTNPFPINILTSNQIPQKRFQILISYMSVVISQISTSTEVISLTR